MGDREGEGDVVSIKRTAVSPNPSPLPLTPKPPPAPQGLTGLDLPRYLEPNFHFELYHCFIFDGAAVAHIVWERTREIEL